jgi:NADH-quinone oxidoreductase subunit C
MTKEEIKSYIEKSFPACKTEETKDFAVLFVEKADLLDVAGKLKTSNDTLFDFLFCETAIDKQTHFEVVYHLTSTTYRHHLVVKVILTDRETPELESVYSLWQGAELLECEIFDLFGIRFTNHPNLRRIFMGDNWQGFPLRKDYIVE